MLGEAIVDVLRAGVVVPDGLFHHDPGKRPLVARNHSRTVEPGGTGFDEAGRNREIENAVVARANFGRDLFEALAEPGVVGRIGEAAADIAQQRGEAAPVLIANTLAGKFLDAVAGEVAIPLVVEILD